ncbi:MAG: phosphatase PAP2 family protein [Aeriscardovia sp.]|nr:phosphatase PAP2 family protein [Aeriscardovia sp.]
MLGGDKKSAASGVHKAPSERSSPLDPLLSSPRPSSLVLCAVLATLMLAASLTVYFLSVHTLFGQEFDEVVWEGFYPLFSKKAPYLVFLPNLFTTEGFIISLICIMGLAGFVWAMARKKFGLALQMFCFAVVAGVSSTLWKHLTPRPDLLSRTRVLNTSPSGHSTAMLIACLLLLMGCAPSSRAWIAVLDWVLASILGISLVIERWHRPSDVVTAFFFVTSISLYSLIFTRKSRMDEAGKRRSRPWLQVLCTLMIVLSIFGLAWGFYLVFQVSPGVQFNAMWIQKPACLASSLLISSSAMLGIGLFGMMHQLTSSPLSPVGLIGPPPRPRSQRRKKKEEEKESEQRIKIG